MFQMYCRWASIPEWEVYSLSETARRTHLPWVSTLTCHACAQHPPVLLICTHCLQRQFRKLKHPVKALCVICRAWTLVYRLLTPLNMTVRHKGEFGCRVCTNMYLARAKASLKTSSRSSRWMQWSMPSIEIVPVY